MPSNSTQTIQILQTNLLQEKQSFAELSALLDQERAALERQDVNALKDFSNKKQQLTKNIELLGQARNNALGELSNLPLNNISKIVEILPDNVQKIWQQVLELAEQCHQSNLVNGKIIQINKNRVARSLQLLKSQKTDPGLTYSSNGIANTSRQAFKAIEA
jgi:flagellar biosynthesis/type III secretory pathway chaperone